MRKWLMGLLAVVALLGVLLAVLVPRRTMDTPSTQPTWRAPRPVPVTWQPLAWHSSWEPMRKPRPRRNPERRARLSKKARLQRRMGLRPRRRQAVTARQPVTAPLPNAADAPVNSAPAPLATLPGVPETPPPPQRRRGRPATVPTDHVFCPVKTCHGFGRLGSHPDHRIVGCGTYPTRSGRRQLYRCEWCHKVFSETQGTVFFGLKTPEETVYRALACLAEGMGIRATARVFDVKPEDILRWLRRAGQHCEQVSAYLMRNLHVEQVQLDELWTFVHKKEKALSAWEALYTRWGDTWIWTAIDPVNKLVLVFLVGEHTETEAVGIVGRVKAVLAEGFCPCSPATSCRIISRRSCRSLGVWCSLPATGRAAVSRIPASNCRMTCSTARCTKSGRTVASFR